MTITIISEEIKKTVALSEIEMKEAIWNYLKAHGVIEDNAIIDCLEKFGNNEYQIFIQTFNKFI